MKLQINWKLIRTFLNLWSNSNLKIIRIKNLKIQKEKVCCLNIEEYRTKNEEILFQYTAPASFFSSDCSTSELFNLFNDNVREDGWLGGPKLRDLYRVLLYIFSILMTTVFYFQTITSIIQILWYSIEKNFRNFTNFVQVRTRTFN